MVETKGDLEELVEEVEGATGRDHKELLSDRGFLVYVTRTYPSIIPYLKGFHLTIKMWRGGRDLEGWKLRDGDVKLVSFTQTVDSWERQEDRG